MENNILHVDMDAFFASVEQRDNEEYRGKPVIVGGISERGVVATCSYEARKYGVHSAMPVFMARQLCPNGIFVSGRYGKYAKVSQEIFNILSEVSDTIEQVSIDEGYIDLSNGKFNDPLEAARYIKHKIYRETKLTVSVGISYNKFLAKLASDWNKPNGIKLISKEMMPEILLPMPLAKVHGLGKVSVGKLNNMGIFYVRDLYKMPKSFYIKYLGKNGIDIYDRIHGNDNRKVEVLRERKSVGKERTLKYDTNNKDELLEYLKEFSYEIEEILERKNFQGKTVTLKTKTKNFENHTRSKTLKNYICKQEEIFKAAEELLSEENLDESLRLIGLSVSSFKEKEIMQMTLF